MQEPLDTRTRNIKIISDGTIYGTKLIDIETGEQIGGVLNIEWKAKASDLVVDCTVTFINIPIEAEITIPVPENLPSVVQTEEEKVYSYCKEE